MAGIEVAIGMKERGWLDKKGQPLEHGDIVLWNPDDDDWYDVIVIKGGQIFGVNELHPLASDTLKIRDNLFGSDNPVLKVGNLSGYCIEVTSWEDL